MGPWLRSHGRHRRRGRTRRFCERLQWGRGFAATEGVDCRQAGIVKTSFNGAVASQPRKVPLRWCPPAWHEPSLQWGRGFAATEGDGAERGDDVANDASMGPWLRSHGRGRGSGFKRCRIPLQWGRGFAATEGRQDAHTKALAERLQWGRGFAATEGSVPSRHSRLASSLQWGRGFAATEGSCAESCLSLGELLQWGRGFAATEGAFRRPGRESLPLASMGPWLRSHGRSPATLNGSSRRRLQWGRGFAATEG